MKEASSSAIPIGYILFWGSLVFSHHCPWNPTDLSTHHFNTSTVKLLTTLNLRKRPPNIFRYRFKFNFQYISIRNYRNKQPLNAAQSFLFVSSKYHNMGYVIHHQSKLSNKRNERKSVQSMKSHSFSPNWNIGKLIIVIKFFRKINSFPKSNQTKKP